MQDVGQITSGPPHVGGARIPLGAGAWTPRYAGGPAPVREPGRAGWPKTAL